MPVYNEKYIKANVREFNGVIKTNFLGDEIPKGSMHYSWIDCITIDSVMRMEKKNYPQVYLEECKYKSKKIKIYKSIRIRVRVRIGCWIRGKIKVRVSFWIAVSLLFLRNFDKSVILLTLNKSKT